MNQLRAGTRKLRKPQWCFHCGERIETGSTVPYQTNAANGSVFTIYLHPECKAACDRCGWNGGECSGRCCPRGKIDMEV